MRARFTHIVVCLLALLGLDLALSRQLKADDNERWASHFKLPGLVNDAESGTVISVQCAGDFLIVGGQFDSPGRAFAVWNLRLQRWVTDCSVLQTDSSGAQPWVNTLLVEGDSVVVGGQFAVDSSRAPQNVAVYHPSTNSWSFPEPLPSGVARIQRIEGKLLATVSLYSSFAEARALELDKGRWTVSSLHIPKQQYLQYESFRSHTYALVEQKQERTFSVLMRRDSSWVRVADSIVDYSSAIYPNTRATLKVSGNFLYLFGTLRVLRPQSGASIATAGLIRFDGQGWTSMISDLQDTIPVCVNDVLDSLGSVWVCGTFNTVDHHLAQCVARYDSSRKEWFAAGSGIAASDWLSSVRCLCMAAGDIYAGGVFGTAGQSYVNSLARYSLSNAAWTAVRDNDCMGLSDAASVSFLNNEMLCYGNFRYGGTTLLNGLGRWDGHSWQAYTSAFIGGVAETTRGLYYLSTGIYPPGLYFADKLGDTTFFAGLFDRINGMRCYNIVGWDGSNLFALDSGLSRSHFDDPYNVYYASMITSMVHYDSNLVMCGDFSKAGKLDVDGVAQWDGHAWKALVSYITFDTKTFKESYQWLRLAVDSSHKLILGGRFYKINKVPMHTLAQWDGTQWLPFAKDSNYVITSFSGLSVLPDGRVMISARIRYKGRTIANGPAVWESSAWHSLGAFDSTRSVPELYCQLSQDSLIYYGGTFDTISTIAAHNVACYNTQNKMWSALGQGIEPSGMGSTAFLTRRVVNTMLRRGDTLVVAGSFIRAGGKPSYNIAEWLLKSKVSTVPDNSLSEVNTHCLFPNPSTGTVELRLQLQYEQRVQVKLVDALGRCVQQWYDGLAGPSEFRSRHDLSTLCAGAYAVSITTEHSMQMIPLKLLH